MKTEEIIGGTFEEWFGFNENSLKEEFIEAYEKDFDKFCKETFEEEVFRK